MLIASCLFYMSFIPVYILILGFTIFVDYIAGILIENAAGRKRKFFLILSLAANIGILAIFKYYNFFISNLNQINNVFNLNHAFPLLSIILPIGLSFHTFQAMSYTIEVYRGDQKAERHFGIYSLYVMFYPQLVAGPIERPQNLLPQFYEKHDIDYQRISDGLKLMLWGFFKKIVVADNLAIYVDAVYDQPYAWDGTTLMIATFFFAYQIYCDFSGYSDIAIGAAQVMGFKLMTNFNRPLHSRTIAEFWKRWHISLATWLRDYIYIPLSRKYNSQMMRDFNLFLTFLIAGIWHGASWAFVIYGAISGFYILFSKWTANYRRQFVKLLGLDNYPKLHHILKVCITFILICIPGIFFRAHGTRDAIYIFSQIVSSIIHLFPQVSEKSSPVASSKFALSFAVIIFLEIIQIAQGKQTIQEFIAQKPMWFRWSFYYIIILAILFLGEFNHRQFIYFQF